MALTLRYSRLFLTGATLVALAACDSEPQVAPIVVDGAFDEWGEVPPSVEDPSDAPAASAVDLGRVQTLDDPRFLYLTLETGRVVTAQAMRGTIFIAIDGDGDARTGALRHGLPGADVQIALSQMPEGRLIGEGMAVLPISANGQALSPVLAGTLDVMASPTYSASKFELRIARARTIDDEGSTLLAGDSVRIALAFADASGVQDTTQVFTHRFQTAAVYGPRIGWNQFLEKRHGVTRVVQWNVASESFRRTPLAFARVLAALDPDVVLLDEVYGDVTKETLDGFFALPPFSERGGSEAWSVVLGRNGGRQKSVVASKLPIRPEPPMLALEYSPDSLARLAASFPDTQFARLLELERDRGLSAAGAWIDLEGSEVLFAAIDLQSRGSDGSPQDRLREVQASVIRDAAARAAGNGGATRPVVIGGDLNLVGSRGPLDRLSRGLDGTADLEPAPALRFLDQSYATWRSHDAVPFTPGRLDFILVPASSLEVDRAFVFDAADLTDQLRESLGVQPDDTRITSDHLPVVVDVRPQPDRPDS